MAKRDGAICIGAVDGAVWISHLKTKGDPSSRAAACDLAGLGPGCELCDAEQCAIAEIKLAATQVLGPSLRGVPEAPLAIDAPDDHRTFREIVYAEEGGVWLFLVRFLQRGDEHGAMPAAARRIFARPLAPDAGDRAARRPRFLV